MTPLTVAESALLARLYRARSLIETLARVAPRELYHLPLVDLPDHEELASELFRYRDDLDALVYYERQPLPFLAIRYLTSGPPLSFDLSSGLDGELRRLVTRHARSVVRG